MDIKVLTYFLQLCRDKNFSTAANKLYISQQGLSVAITRLEKELDCNLFLRTSRGLVLTDCGQYLKEHAEVIVNQNDMCTDYFKLMSESSDIIRIACISEFVGNSSPLLQSIFLNQDPAFNMRVIESPSRECEVLIKNEECILGVLTEPFDKNFFYYKELLTITPKIIVNTKHKLASLDRIDIIHLKNEPLVVMSSMYNSYQFTYKFCADAGFEPNIVYQTTHAPLIPDMIKKNPRLVGRTSDFYTRGLNDPSLKTFSLDSISTKVCLVHKKNLSLPKSVAKLKNLIIKDFQSNRRP